MTEEVLISEMLSFPKLKKIEFIQLLAQSVAEEERIWQENDQYSEELKTVLFKRLKDAESGVAKLIPIEEFEAKLANKYGIQFPVEENWQEDYELTEEQKATLLKRIEDVKSGAAKTILAEEVVAKIRKKYGFSA